VPSRVTLSQLEAFRAVAKSLSYSRAAEELGYSEPSVYQQVRALERVLQVKLFSANKHRIQLTDAGSQLSQLAQEACAVIAQFEHRALEMQRASTARVLIGAASMTCDFVLQEAVEHFNLENPEIHLDFQRAASRDAVPERLAGGLLDLGIWSPGPSDKPRTLTSGLTATPWISDEWIVVRASAHAPPHLLYHPTQAWIVPHILALHERLPGLAISECVVLDTVEGVKSAALGHLGYALVSGMSIAREVAHGMLEPVARSGIPRELLLLVSEDASPTTLRVRDFFLLWWKTNRDRFRNTIVGASATVGN
jgi:DNA-binding transcriptional LysR family regulator